jgi:cysteine-rich repeat protein
MKRATKIHACVLTTLLCWACGGKAPTDSSAGTGAAGTGGSGAGSSMGGGGEGGGEPKTTCGDMVVQDGEACDDGNDVVDDGCNNQCQLNGAILQETVLDVGTVEDLVMDASGATYLVGTKRIDNDSDMWLAKLGPAGELVWSQTYTTEQNLGEHGRGIALAADGDIIAVGQEQPMFGELIFGARLIRVTTDGETVWDTSYGGVEPYALAMTNDGDVVVAGRANVDESPFDYDAWIGRFSGVDGTFANETLRAGPGGGDVARDVAVLPNDRVVVAGSLAVDPTQGNTRWVAVLDAAGNLVWEDLADGLPGEFHDHALAVAADAEGNIYVAGLLDGIGAEQHLWSFTADGTARWTHEVADADTQSYIDALAFDAAGHLVGVGLHQDAPWVVKLDVASGSSPSVVWQSHEAVEGSHSAAFAVAAGPNDVLAVGGGAELQQGDLTSFVRIYAP